MLETADVERHPPSGEKATIANTDIQSVGSKEELRLLIVDFSAHTDDLRISVRADFPGSAFLQREKLLVDHVAQFR